MSKFIAKFRKNKDYENDSRNTFDNDGRNKKLDIKKKSKRNRVEKEAIYADYVNSEYHNHERY